MNLRRHQTEGTRTGFRHLSRLRGGVPRRYYTRRECAFTLVEVALALAIIGFALVAIIGILPAGLNVQRENREETVINQEVSIWMDAIRSGAQGMDYLTNYVDGIRIASTPLNEYGEPDTADGEPEAVDYFTPVYSSVGAGYELTSGFRIVGLLSWPTYGERPGFLGTPGVLYSNSIVAYVRSISGAASEAAPQDNPIVRESAFAYRLTSEVVPFIAHSGPWTNHAHFLLLTGGTNAAQARSLWENAHDVRLEFRWPLRPPLDDSFDPPIATNFGNGRLVFRSLIGGTFTALTHPFTNDSSFIPLFLFFQPGQYAQEGG